MNINSVYDATITSGIDKTLIEPYICKYCNDIYTDVHQLDCGCRGCLKCIQIS